MVTTNPNDYYKVKTATGYDIYDKATNRKYTADDLMNPQKTGFVVNVDHIPVGQVPQQQTQQQSQQQSQLPTPGQEQIQRVGDDFYYISPTGQKTYLTQQQFQSMGINADFVQPGQTVSIQEAKQGGSANVANKIMGGTNGYYLANAANQRVSGDFSAVNGDYDIAYKNAQAALKQAQNPQAIKEETTTNMTGNPIFDATLAEYQKMLDSMLQSGQQLNPNIEIDPTTAKRFVDLASEQIDPYYSSQIKAIKSDLDADFQELQKSYEQTKASTEQTFKQSLGLQQESEAERGTIFSGGRTRREGEMAQATDRSLQALQESTLSKGRELGATAERNIGSLGITGITPPSIQGYQTAGLGAFTPTTSRSLYTPETGVMGSLERERETERQKRIADLRTGYKEERVL